MWTIKQNLSQAVLAMALLMPCCQAQATRSRGAQSFADIAAKAENARQANRLDEAERYFRQGVKLKPSWSEGWWALGTILYDQDKYAEASRAFERLAALNPKNGTARLFLGLCEFELGKDDASLEKLRQARELGILNDPQLRTVTEYHEALLNLKKSRFETALQVLNVLNRQGVRSPEVQLAFGMAMLHLEPSELPSDDPARRELVRKIGEAQQLAASNEFDAAKAAYSSLVAKNPEFRNIHFAYGRFLLDTHDIEAAVAEFEKEIANNPNSVMARLQIAATKYRTDSAAGIPYAEEAVKLDPKYPFGHYLLGLLYSDNGDAEKAIPQLEIARTAFPNESKVYFALGNAYAKVGRKADAAAARQKFLAIQNTSSQANPETSVATSGADRDPQPKAETSPR